VFLTFLELPLQGVKYQSTTSKLVVPALTMSERESLKGIVVYERTSHSSNIKSP
jgi:hypothetical protein